jgi:hypothetical protein
MRVILLIIVMVYSGIDTRTSRRSGRSHTTIVLCLHVCGAACAMLIFRSNIKQMQEASK